ncbi:MAG: ABC transporter ATP-binding protein [Hyphomicrobiales bacterium]|nr:ABC transporter ATP-binding protein [Hyphomicrobiales bacterium]MBV8823604.1 ABC transporter ATP-binding protein [Hyphomicrobiales bacterium]MBV9429762.1 ABC transporter ATP-binding protein [Bradyrhizobiaceae bacterium]
MSAIVSVEDLVVGYGDTTAVERVSFTVAAGEHVTLLGPSGCGKTTTLRAVAGLERPHDGRIVIDGVPVYDRGAGINIAPEKRGLSMVFQSYAIWPHMSVADNVAFPLRVRGVPRKLARTAVERALALVDLADFADRPATRLSGGQQQRVALARAIAFETKVVLLDEPLSNLDAQLRLQMRGELADLRRRIGFTAIYVTHDQEEAFSLSDRIMVMRSGRIEQQGTPAEIHAAPRTRFIAAFLGVRNIFAADIAGASSDTVVEARLADGTVLRARDPWGDGRGGHAAVAFRPGAVHLEAVAASGRAGNIGTVTRSLLVGDMAQIFICSGPLEICALARPRSDFAKGSSVAWRVDPDDCLVLRE